MYTKKFRETNILVLTRKKGKSTEKCPYCNTRHIHGFGDGHRNAHCASSAIKKSKIIFDGVEVIQSDGYYIETI